MFTYKGDASGQKQDPDKQVLKLLNDQLPDALTCRTRTQSVDNNHLIKHALECICVVQVCTLWFGFVIDQQSSVASVMQLSYGD